MVPLVNVVKEFCHECPECHRVFEYDDYIQEVSLVRPPEESTVSAPLAHLKNVLQKCGIYGMFTFNDITFLGEVIAQFRMRTSKSVNYSCFLHNYFEAVPSVCHYSFDSRYTTYTTDEPTARKINKIFRSTK